MQIQSGIPFIFDYNKVLNSNLFFGMENFSNQFLKLNKKVLAKYKWGKDPLHSWSRVWEYPFIYSNICNLENKKNEVKVLDAGSGLTFFPFFLASKFKKLKIHCCDSDNKLNDLFNGIIGYEEQIKFEQQDIRYLSYQDKSFDAIYCVSVLEHTEDYELILKEFKRILKPGGCLVITFDISFDSDWDISIEKAEQLKVSLEQSFSAVEPLNFEIIKQILSQNKDKILTTEYIRSFNPGWLPWRLSNLDIIKSILKFRYPKPFFKNLTCFGNVYKKHE